MPDLIPGDLAGLLIFLAALCGYLVGRWHAHDSDERLAAAIYDEFVAAQTDDDNQALASLPPGLLAGDVWAYAARHGIGIREAGEILFVAQARARLDANVRAHHGRPRPAPEESDQ